MEIIKLFDEEFFKKLSNADANIDNNLISMAIIDAQSIHLEPLIGYTLVNKLKTDSQSGSITESYANLLTEFIYPFLLKATEYELVMRLMIRETNQGLVTNVNTDKQTVDTPMYRELKGDIESKMAIYAGRILRYLEFNAQSFPEYIEYTSDRINAQKSVNHSSIYFDPAVQLYARNKVNQDFNSIADYAK